MRIMALDTSGKAVSVAVAEDGRLCSHFYLRHGKTHAEALMPCIDATLSGLDLKLSDIGAFAAITGPGSFTGLRIGLAAVKAMAYANNVGVVGVPTLDALAYNMHGYPDALLCPVMDARNGNVYQAIYLAACAGADAAAGADTAAGANPGAAMETAAGTGADAAACADTAACTGEFMKTAACAGEFMKTVEFAALLSKGAAADRLKSALKLCGGVKRVIFNGDAAETYFDFFRGELAGLAQCTVAEERAISQNAAAAALLACGAVAAGRLEPPGHLVPEYLNDGYIRIHTHGA